MHSKSKNSKNQFSVTIFNCFYVLNTILRDKISNHLLRFSTTALKMTMLKSIYTIKYGEIKTLNLSKQKNLKIDLIEKKQEH